MSYLFDRTYYDAWDRIINRFIDSRFDIPANWKLHFLKENENMDTTAHTHEKKNSEYKYNFSYPGVSPDKVSVRLRADKATIDIYVNNKLQRSLAPLLAMERRPFEGQALVAPLSEENIKVTMEHGLLTIVVTPPHRNDALESVVLPINGKKFLQEDKDDITSL